MTPENVKELTDVIEKSLPEMVETATKTKLDEIQAKQTTELEEVKAELKKLAFEAKGADRSAVNEMITKTTIVSVVKEVIARNITSEKAFNDVVQATIKTMASNEAEAGQELVFEQFEADVLRIMDTYELINYVRVLPLAKGDKISIPRVTNGITTYWTKQGQYYIESDAETGFLTINVGKATTLTDITEELLDDAMTVPDFYNLIVEMIAESQAEFIESELLTGTLYLKGILTETNIGVVEMGAGDKVADIDDSVLQAIVGKAKSKYKRNKANVRWYLTQYSLTALKSLVTTDGYPLYPSLRDANPTLLGYAVTQLETGLVTDTATDVAGKFAIMFGDLSFYRVVRRKGLTMEQGYYGDNWKKDIKSVKSNQRIGGALTYPEAIAVLKLK